MVKSDGEEANSGRNKSPGARGKVNSLSATWSSPPPSETSPMPPPTRVRSPSARKLRLSVPHPSPLSLRSVRAPQVLPQDVLLRQRCHPLQGCPRPQPREPPCPRASPSLSPPAAAQETARLSFSALSLLAARTTNCCCSFSRDKATLISKCWQAMMLLPEFW